MRQYTENIANVNPTHVASSNVLLEKGSSMNNLHYQSIHSLNHPPVGLMSPDQERMAAAGI